MNVLVTESCLQAYGMQMSLIDLPVLAYEMFNLCLELPGQERRAETLFKMANVLDYGYYYLCCYVIFFFDFKLSNRIPS